MDIHGEGAFGVSLPRPVAVPGGDPLVGAGAVGGAADRVGLGAHQRLHEFGDHPRCCPGPLQSADRLS